MVLNFFTYMSEERSDCWKEVGLYLEVNTSLFPVFHFFTLLMSRICMHSCTDALQNTVESLFFADGWLAPSRGRTFPLLIYILKVAQFEG